VSNHFEITKGITEFCQTGFTAQSTSVCMPEMVAPRRVALRVSRYLSAGQEERRLWERDWIHSRMFPSLLPSLHAFVSSCDWPTALSVLLWLSRVTTLATMLIEERFINVYCTTLELVNNLTERLISPPVFLF